MCSAQVAHRQVLERPEAQHVRRRNPAQHWSDAICEASDISECDLHTGWSCCQLHDGTAGPERFRNHSAGGREGGGGAAVMSIKHSAVRGYCTSTELQRACRPSSFSPDVQRAAD